MKYSDNRSQHKIPFIGLIAITPAVVLKTIVPNL